MCEHLHVSDDLLIFISLVPSECRIWRRFVERYIRGRSMLQIEDALLRVRVVVFVQGFINLLFEPFRFVQSVFASGFEILILRGTHIAYECRKFFVCHIQVFLDCYFIRIFSIVSFSLSYVS